MTTFIKGRNRAWAQLSAPVNGSVVNIPLVAGQGSRLYPVTTASGLNVRAHLIERDPITGAVIACEVVNITNNVSDILTVTRAVESTRATDATNTYSAVGQSFTAAAIIEEIISVEVLEEMRTAIQTLETGIPTTYATKAEVAAGSLVYGASSNGTDTYSVSIPNISAYTQGFKFSFLADVANNGQGYVRVTGSAGLLAILEIKKNHDQSLVTGDIEAGQIVEVVVNTTEVVAQMKSQIATVVDLSGYTSRTENMTLADDVVAGDSVYPSAADTVKKVYPSAMGAGAAITTSPTSNRPCKIIQISNNVILQVSGNDGNSGGAALVAQVRTLNAAETDFTYGTEASILGTATTYFDVCKIDTSTFAVIYQKTSGGSPVGLQVVILTVSGTTITVGSPTTIETSGSTSWQCSICKVDTLKCLITYRKDSDGKPYVQVLTVSGTTITTNTPVNMKNSGNTHRVVSNQIAAGRCILSYTDTSTQNIYCRTVDISGTTPTVNTESAALDNQSADIYVGDVKMISATKGIITYGINTTNYIKVITLSGTGNNTITAGTATTLSATTRAPGGTYFGCVLIGSGYMLHAAYSGASTTVLVDFLSIGATTTTLISNQGLSCSASTYGATCLCKISPWTYLVTGTVANSDSIIKMTPVSTRIGVMEATAASGATAAVTLRFQKAVLSGLTAGSLYYVDDDATPTINSSLTAVALGPLGIAKSTTSLLLT